MDISGSNRLDTAATLAEFLSVSIAYVRKLTRLNKLPVVRIGRRVLIRQEALQNWIRQAEQGEREGPGPLNVRLIA